MTAYSRTNFKDSGELLLLQQLLARGADALLLGMGGGVCIPAGFLEHHEVHSNFPHQEITFIQGRSQVARMLPAS